MSSTPRSPRVHPTVKSQPTTTAIVPLAPRIVSSTAPTTSTVLPTSKIQPIAGPSKMASPSTIGANQVSVRPRPYRMPSPRVQPSAAETPAETSEEIIVTNGTLDLSLTTNRESSFSVSHCGGFPHVHTYSCYYSSTTPISTFGYYHAQSMGSLLVPLPPPYPMTTYMEGMTVRECPRTALSAFGRAQNNLYESFKNVIRFLKAEAYKQIIYLEERGSYTLPRDFLMHFNYQTLDKIEQRFLENCQVWNEVNESLIHFLNNIQVEGNFGYSNSEV